ncbi:hypothetical protein BC834DRAFT_518082 [Gloeopeniophorella convolvens]|nr:hypothetical protein BC834DRAFT_518082 [Gloeopeniophorella convolvens]
MNHIPDELLVEIFDIYRPNYTPFPPAVSRAADEETLLPWWYTLIRVCRRWYRVVRHAKCRLNLALRCTRHALLGEMLLFAPLEFPVFLDFRWLAHGYVRRKDANGVARILQHPERLRGVALDAYPLTLSNMLASMVRPVPQLETLHLRKIGSKAATSHFPSNFLGGSAPKLTSLSLSGIAPLGPASWNWLASATSLTSLDLARVEYTLERVKVCLRGMPLLERLSLDFVDPAPPVFTSPCHNSDTERVNSRSYRC